MVWVRLLPEAIASLDERATAEGVRRSELLRRMLTYAEQKMPGGWVP